MGFLHVQTYTISKGKIEEHDELMKKIMSNTVSKFGKKVRVFHQRYGPIGARVIIHEFKDNDELFSFWHKFDDDEEAVNLRSKWNELIDPASWRALFWIEKTTE